MVTQVKIYNGSTWVDYDLSVDSSRVFFNQDLKLTETFGKYKVDSSTPNVTVPANGKSWKEILIDAYSTDVNPEKVDPSITAFNVTGNGASSTSFEIGTTVLPQWTSTFSGGSYSYKSTASKTNINPVAGTGVSATGWTIKQGTVEIGTVEDGTAANAAKFAIGAGNTSNISGSVTYSAVASYNAGRYALTKLDNLPTTDVQIVAGSTPAKTDTLSWYRKMFGGGTTAGLTSAVIRGLAAGASANARASSNPFEFKASKGDIKVVFAYPTALTTKTPKFQMFTMNWGDTIGFVSSKINVADARGGENGLMEYTVWTYTPAGAFTADETKYRVYF